MSNSENRNNFSPPPLFQIVLFDGTETSRQPFLLKDSRGRSLSRLVIPRIDHSHAGVYSCNPASAAPVAVTVHVLNGTVLAVAEGDKGGSKGQSWGRKGGEWSPLSIIHPGGGEGEG